MLRLILLQAFLWVLIGSPATRSYVLEVSKSTNDWLNTHNVIYTATATAPPTGTRR